jgi:hypothetical protein
MPFYKIAEMQKNRATANPKQFVQTAVGEFMKAGIVKKPRTASRKLRGKLCKHLTIDGRARSLAF